MFICLTTNATTTRIYNIPIYCCTITCTIDHRTDFEVVWTSFALAGFAVSTDTHSTPQFKGIITVGGAFGPFSPLRPCVVVSEITSGTKFVAELEAFKSNIARKEKHVFKLMLYLADKRTNSLRLDWYTRCSQDTLFVLWSIRQYHYRIIHLPPMHILPGKRKSQHMRYQILLRHTCDQYYVIHAATYLIRSGCICLI